ncbi:MAG TPA: thioredoxin family protein [Candidatus Babeliales bacterium]|nr:thioredoxin family protein [Candidatus Babeliales bacterium]
MAPSNRNMLLIGAIVFVTSIGYYMQWRTTCVVPSCPKCPQAAQSIATIPSDEIVTAQASTEPVKPAPVAAEIATETAPAAQHGVTMITTQQEFDQLIAANDKPVVFKIFAPWCGPCKGMKPVFEKAAQEFGDRITFVEINQDEFDNADALNTPSIPAIIGYKNGKEAARLVGSRSLPELKKELTALISAE